MISEGPITPKQLMRVIRSILVILVNGGILYFSVFRILDTRARQQADPVLHFQAGPLTPDILWLAPLGIGILLEFSSFRLARFVNVGYYAFSASYIIISTIFAVAQIFGFSEGEHWGVLVVVMAVPEAALAVLLFRLYRLTAPVSKPGGA